MSEDIVKQLNSPCDWCTNCSACSELMRMAGNEIERLRGELNGLCPDCYTQSLRQELDNCRSLLRSLLAKLPHERHDLTTGRCAGCGAVHWCGDGKGADPCKPDCVLQEAMRAAKAGGGE